jgi:L-amino acid N-acyltransferase YncA
VTQVHKLADASPILERIEIRPLTADDSSAYFERRSEILEMGDGHYFSDSYERERQLTTEPQRRDWCSAKREHCIMGAFTNGKLVGFVMITQYGPPEDSTVEWEAAWMHPRYRGTGLTKALYEQVQQRTVDQGYSFVKSFIRADNKRWLDIRRRLGFVNVGIKRNDCWADGTYGDTHVLQFDLRAFEPALQQQKEAIRHLEQTVDVLENSDTPPAGNREAATSPSTRPTPTAPHRRFG